MGSSQVTKLLDDIQRILHRDGKTIGDLARDLKRSYHQVWDWVSLRRNAPRSEVVMQLIDWKNKHEKRKAKHE
jgi:hypothetical protein